MSCAIISLALPLSALQLPMTQATIQIAMQATHTQASEETINTQSDSTELVDGFGSLKRVHLKNLHKDALQLIRIHGALTTRALTDILQEEPSYAQCQLIDRLNYHLNKLEASGIVTVTKLPNRAKQWQLADQNDEPNKKQKIDSHRSEANEAEELEALFFKFKDDLNRHRTAWEKEFQKKWHELYLYRQQLHQKEFILAQQAERLQMAAQARANFLKSLTVETQKEWHIAPTKTDAPTEEQHGEDQYPVPLPSPLPIEPSEFPNESWDFTRVPSTVFPETDELS